MNGGYLALVVALLVISAIAMVVAAFADRRRGREIEHDLHHPHQP
jgi:hypothetical protein